MNNNTLNLLNELSILVVEDDEIARIAIKQGIGNHCKRYYEAEDGLEGLEKFKKEQIDIIITDIHMPALNGFDMIEEIRKLKPNQLFIVMTSYDTDENLITSINEGVFSFLRKPLIIEELQTSLLIAKGRLQYTTKQLSSSIKIDYRNEDIFLNNKHIFLSFNNHKIFWLLCYNLGNLVSYEMIEDYIYDCESVNKSTLHNAILRIKHQLPSVIIDNIQNQGYILKTNL
ncbi:response regulator [Campylobacterota bacterium DY0563]